MIQTPIEIPAEAEVTIDLAGFTIYGYLEEEAVFLNKGTLSIIDSTADKENENESTYSSIINEDGIAIINSGSLTIGEDKNDVNTNSPRIIGKTTAIENNTGTLNFYDGQICTEEPGEIINGDSSIKVPEGYKAEKSNNNYILVKEESSL